MSESVPVMWMRAGTSKGGFFLATDLPADTSARDALLLRLMGSPDARQIDGLGGADPLTSKVAVVRLSSRHGIDVEYLFLQVFVDEATVSDSQNCGNMLAGVGGFAIERGLVQAEDGVTSLNIYMVNTGQSATARVQTPGGQVSYAGEARIDGVPGTAAPVLLEFRDTAGSTCGALFPTGDTVNKIDNTPVTLIDNGMPCVVIRAADMDISGKESPAELEQNTELKTRLESIRLQAGVLMNLGDVSAKSVPKMNLLSEPCAGGEITTRTFIPHCCHKAIGVLGAVSVATSCLSEGAIGFEMVKQSTAEELTFNLEHPTGMLAVVVRRKHGKVETVANLRTARKLFDGHAFT